MTASEVKLGVKIIYEPLKQECRIIDFNKEERDKGTLKSVKTRFLGDEINLRIKACTLSE